MIAWRYLFRCDHAWKITNTYVISRPIKYLQRCSYCHGISNRSKVSEIVATQSIMDRNKKQRTTSAVCRPVCTQCSSYEECFVENVEVESENLHMIDGVEKSDDGSKALENIDEDKSLEGVTRCPAEKHSIAIEVGNSLIRFIKGKGGSTQKKIEEEMGVKITFSLSKKEDSIIIEGKSMESVTRASEEIQVIIKEAVKSPTLDYSHFVSLPLAIHAELVNKLVNFQNCILGNSDPIKENLDSDSNADTSDVEDKGQQLDRGIDVTVQLKVEDGSNGVKVDITNIPLTSYPPKESKSSKIPDLRIDKSIFIKPKTFHLTVLMLKLWNKERVDTATAILQSVSSKVRDALGSRPVFVKLKGLDCMRGSLAKARVLYAPVEEVGNEGRLLLACQVIIDAFVEAGLVLEKDATQQLKLHATVMNARHRRRKKGNKNFDSFDARGIAKQYGSEEWGEYLIREAHLSQRFVFDEDGYYHCCASIPFPENMVVD